MGETSTKPYLIRALHEWCTDNGYTPYVVVRVDEHTLVPVHHVQDGQITLNVGTLAAATEAELSEVMLLARRLERVMESSPTNSLANFLSFERCKI